MTDLVRINHRIGGFELALDAPLAPGVTAIFGPSGAGKTTILRILAGLVRPESGKIVIDGQTWLDTSTGTMLPPAKRRVGYVFQEPRLFPHLTVRRNLVYGARSADPAKVHGLTETLGIGALLDRRPTSLSGGEAQRVALGRALLSDPKVLLMDEPLSALDHARKTDILRIFAALKDRAALPILYVSHDIDEVAQIADHIILIDQGQSLPSRPVAEALAGSAFGSRIGRDIAGGLLEARIVAYHDDDALTEVRVGACTLWLPGDAGQTGDQVRLRLDARDITLALDHPSRISALNVLPASIVAIDDAPGSGTLVRLDHEGRPLAARLTRKSVRDLQLRPGLPVFALIKSMSVAAGRIARR